MEATTPVGFLDMTSVMLPISSGAAFLFDK